MKCTAAGLGILLLLGAVAAAKQADGPAAPTADGKATPSLKVGIVNLSDCFDDARGLAEYLDLRNEYKERVKMAQGELDEVDKQINIVKSKLTDLADARDTELYRDLRKQLGNWQAQKQARQQVSKMELEEERLKIFGKVYESIMKAAEAVAKEKGLELVLKDNVPSVEEQSDEAKFKLPALTRMQQSPIIWALPGLDITKEVMTRANEVYRAARAPQAVPSPSPSGPPGK